MTEKETKKMLDLVKTLKERSSKAKNEMEYYKTNLKICKENKCPADILKTFDLKIHEKMKESDTYYLIINEILDIMSD